MPASDALFGSAIAAVAPPALAAAKSTVSGRTCSVQLGTAVANTADSGNDAGAKPVTANTNAFAGSPLACDRQVLPAHGRSAVSVLAPPLLGQPAPSGVVVAG